MFDFEFFELDVPLVARFDGMAGERGDDNYGDVNGFHLSFFKTTATPQTFNVKSNASLICRRPFRCGATSGDC